MKHAISKASLEASILLSIQLSLLARTYLDLALDAGLGLGFECFKFPGQACNGCKVLPAFG